MAFKHEQNFDSWAEFVEAVQQPRVWGHGDRCNSHATRAWWYGTASFEEAVDLALHGWKEGRDRMADGLQCAPSVSVYSSRQMDVGGAYPIIPIALAGDPCSMVDEGAQTIAAHPIVRLRVDIVAPGSVDTNAMINNGIAALSIVDAMESAGYSVELSIGSAITDEHLLIVTVKRAGQSLDLDRAAFALANPSMLRRFHCALMEQQQNLAHLKNTHGCPQPCPKVEGVIILPPPHNSCESVAAALERMQRVLDGHSIALKW